LFLRLSSAFDCGTTNANKHRAAKNVRADVFIASSLMKMRYEWFVSALLG